MFESLIEKVFNKIIYIFKFYLPLLYEIVVNLLLICAGEYAGEDKADEEGDASLTNAGCRVSRTNCFSISQAGSTYITKLARIYNNSNNYTSPVLKYSKYVANPSLRKVSDHQ